jgi:Histidine kinase-like ATPase domain
VEAPGGAARVERQPVRNAARAQPLDGPASDRHEQMSTVRVSVDLPPTPQAPRATRRVLHSVLELWGWGSTTAREDVAQLASEVVTSAVEHAAAEHTLVLEMARSEGWLRLSVADGAAVRRIVRDLDHRYPSGPGVRLIEALADRWGVEDHHGGTRVWFELNHNTDHHQPAHNPEADRVGDG